MRESCRIYMHRLPKCSKSTDYSTDLEWLEFCHDALIAYRHMFEEGGMKLPLRDPVCASIRFYLRKIKPTKQEQQRPESPALWPLASGSKWDLGLLGVEINILLATTGYINAAYSIVTMHIAKLWAHKQNVPCARDQADIIARYGGLIIELTTVTPEDISKDLFGIRCELSSQMD